MIKNKGKWIKKKCTYSINRETASKFDLLCSKKKANRYEVVEKLLTEYINREIKA